MLFFNILLIIYCVYTAALSSGAQFRTAVLNAPAATHQIGVSAFLLFSRLRRQEVCSITTSGQNGKVEDEEACPRSPKESEVHAEIQPGHLTHPSGRPRQPPGRLKTLGTRITSSQLHGPGAVAASKVHARLGSGANSTNAAASFCSCVLLPGLGGSRLGSGGRSLRHQHVMWPSPGEAGLAGKGQRARGPDSTGQRGHWNECRFLLPPAQTPEEKDTESERGKCSASVNIIPQMSTPWSWI